MKFQKSSDIFRLIFLENLTLYKIWEFCLFWNCLWPNLDFLGDPATLAISFFEVLKICIATFTSKLSYSEISDFRYRQIQWATPLNRNAHLFIYLKVEKTKPTKTNILKSFFVNFVVWFLIVVSEKSVYFHITHFSNFKLIL
jgi:hypothetical protein